MFKRFHMKAHPSLYYTFVCNRSIKSGESGTIDGHQSRSDSIKFKFKLNRFVKRVYTKKEKHNHIGWWWWAQRQFITSFSQNEWQMPSTKHDFLVYDPTKVARRVDSIKCQSIGFMTVTPFVRSNTKYTITQLLYGEELVSCSFVSFTRLKA